MTKGEDLHEKITGCPDMWDALSADERAVWERDAEAIWEILYSDTGLGRIIEARQILPAPPVPLTYASELAHIQYNLRLVQDRPGSKMHNIARLSRVGALIACEIDRLLDLENRLPCEGAMQADEEG